MSVTDEIFRSWRSPRSVIRRQLPTITEARALSYLMMACVFIVIAQAPRIARQAHFDPDIPFEPQMVAAALGIFAIVPAVAFLLSALSHLAARALGGQGSWLGARLALFWTLLALSPLVLLYGLVAGFIGPGVQLTLVGILLSAAFFIYWVLAWVAAEWTED